MKQQCASLPGLTRQSIALRKRMDARIKSAHDKLDVLATLSLRHDIRNDCRQRLAGRIRIDLDLQAALAAVDEYAGFAQ
jgi:hypothetical protein